VLAQRCGVVGLRVEREREREREREGEGGSRAERRERGGEYREKIPSGFGFSVFRRCAFASAEIRQAPITKASSASASASASASSREEIGRIPNRAGNPR